MSLLPPRPLTLRHGEQIVWSGAPAWRSLAVRVYHVHWLALYGAALLLANAVAAHNQHLSTANSLRGEVPVLLFVGLVLAGASWLAWATARSTRYTVTDQRIILQHGVALTAMLSIPMRAVAAVSVSDQATGDIAISLRKGHRVALLRIWPHARPWAWRNPAPSLRAIGGASGIAGLLARTVAAAQAVEIETSRELHKDEPQPVLMDA